METKSKPKYKVYVWNNDADNTETVFEAPAKPTLKQLYELIGCSLVERVSGYDKSVSNRSFDIWIDEEGKFKFSKASIFRVSKKMAHCHVRQYQYLYKKKASERKGYL